MMRTRLVIGMVVFAVVALLVQRGIARQDDVRGGSSGSGVAAFVAFDVVVEVERGLGAWQVEIRADEGMVVSAIEGGEGVYSEPAYYDTRAINEKLERVVIGDFSLAEPLPSGRVRVARVHFFCEEGEKGARARLEAAGDGEGARMEGTVELVRSGAEDEGDAS